MCPLLQLFTVGPITGIVQHRRIILHMASDDCLDTAAPVARLIAFQPSRNAVLTRQRILRYLVKHRLLAGRNLISWMLRAIVQKFPARYIVV